LTVDPALEPQTSNEPRVPLRLFVLKHGDTFVVADAFGVKAERMLPKSADRIFLRGRAGASPAGACRGTDMSRGGA
jgi:hypothetical protein